MLPKVTRKTGPVQYLLLEVLVSAGIPWKGGFLSHVQAAARFWWMKSVGNFCVTEVDSSKVGLGQFQNSNSFLKFVRFNFFPPLHGVTANECARV